MVLSPTTTTNTRTTHRLLLMALGSLTALLVSAVLFHVRTDRTVMIAAQLYILLEIPVNCTTLSLQLDEKSSHDLQVYKNLICF